MRSSLKFLASVCVSLVLGASAWAAPYSALYVFGDSLSDAGSNPSAVTSIYKLLGNACDRGHPCPPYVGGRGWIGVYLDVEQDWDDIAEIVGDAHATVTAGRRRASGSGISG